LRHLGFKEYNIDRRGRAYHHTPSDTLIIMACHDHSLPARDADLMSIRRHLVDNDLVDPDEFDEFLACDE
jgi:hypothetical protein